MKRRFFYIVFSFWYLMDIILRTDFKRIINEFMASAFRMDAPDINAYVDTAVLVLLIIQIVFLQHYNSREIILLAVISIPITLATIISGNNFLISLLLFVIASKYADIDEVVDLAYKILVIMIPVIILMCFIGVLPDYTMYRHSLLRHSLGFEHPNRLGMRLFQLAACHCYVHRNRRFRISTIFIVTALTLFAYRVPNSQTSYICLTLLMCLVVFKHFIDKHNIRVTKVLRVFTVISAFIIYGSTVMCFFNPKKYYLFNLIDKFMSRRFYWCNRMYQHYGFTWLGQKVSTRVQDSRYIGIYRQLYLDNAFFSILLCFGVIVFFIFSILYMAAIIHFMKEGNYMIVSIMMLYAVYGMMTTGFYMMSHNIFLLGISSVVYAKKDSEDVLAKRTRIRFSF